ncbi:hypothetical protein GN244_ATG13659 [Phytophthora infestans]|uniref:Uncharacterized protein n=1 Tax=Phytophthora infestans TaxID=4787 RepID=A0A833SWS6_PHYIN|nr:hypothetical protein GN244_ATG13659 [Phytophthora infestans]KAF4146284.1 hypothetical protein GN958_ATG04524 [Phytophthora infestans]
MTVTTTAEVPLNANRAAHLHPVQFEIVVVPGIIRSLNQCHTLRGCESLNDGVAPENRSKHVPIEKRRPQENYKTVKGTQVFS